MPTTASFSLLTLPVPALERVSQPAVHDAIEYFETDLVVIPGPRDMQAYATVRQAAPDVPVVHPQHGQRGNHVHHFRYAPDTGVEEASHTSPEPAEAIDVIAVQSVDVLDQLDGQLPDQPESGRRSTGPDAATFVIVPELTVEWDATALSAELPHDHQLAALVSDFPEPVTVLAGGQPATYYHEWTLTHDGATVRLPVAGLGATDREGPTFARYTCTANGAVAAADVDADEFGLRALAGVGPETANQLRNEGCRRVDEVRDLAVSELEGWPGVGRRTAENIHAHAEVIDSGEPLLLTNDTPVKTRGDRPPLCIDIETDGLSPTIIWQIGVYDPLNDQHQAFVERDDPSDPVSLLEVFIEWLLGNHNERTLLAWNGWGFDYPHIRRFLEQHLPAYTESWDDLWKYDLYKWAVQDDNALLPGRTNRLGHVARALGFDDGDTGLTGAQTAAAYQEFMQAPDDPDREPDWDRHEAYCEHDCRALWHVYQAIVDAPRRATTDSGSGGADGQQAGLTDF
jgi:hypothetical protein